MSKRETITITFQGSKKFKQALVNRIYEVLVEDEFVEEATQPGCGFTFESSIVQARRARMDKEQKNKELMKARVEGDKVVVEIPLDLLVFSQAQREDSLTIVDRRAMAEYVVENILDFGGDAEIGATEFEMLLDKLFIDALESGESWLQGWWEGDEEGGGG